MASLMKSSTLTHPPSTLRLGYDRLSPTPTTSCHRWRARVMGDTLRSQRLVGQQEIQISKYLSPLYLPEYRSCR
eukprot:746310-Hanusia_phi.AAC.1